jgi:hypothetical protein
MGENCAGLAITCNERDHHMNHSWDVLSRSGRRTLIAVVVCENLARLQGGQCSAALSSPLAADPLGLSSPSY